MRLQQKAERGIVLIVVVGVLAVLSLLAATFGMLMSVELAASRNQTEHEMANEAAQAAAMDLAAQVDAFVRVNGYMPADLSSVLTAPVDALGSRELYRRDKVKVYTALGPCGTPPTAWTLPLGRSFTIALSGTATGGSGTTIADSTQSWLWDDLVGWYVMQASGNGAGQFRRIVRQAVNDPIRREVSPAWGTAPVAGVEYWIIPSVYTGEFNLNAMGYAGDLGKEDSGNYRTSFDASLRRLVAEGLTASRKGELTATYRGMSSGDQTAISGILATKSVDEWARIAAEAITNWRNGPDNAAGNRFSQDHRPDHLLDANAANAWTTSMTPAVTGSELYFGKLQWADATGSNVTAAAPYNVTLPATWPNGKWSSKYVTFGSGRAKGNTFTVSTDSGGAMALSSASGAQAGDSFCLHTDPLPVPFGSTDEKPDAIQWPDAMRWIHGFEATAGTVMTEEGVLWRVIDSGYVTAYDPGSPDRFTGSNTWTVDHANCLVWFVAGAGAGQVRPIVSTGGNTLIISGGWNVVPVGNDTRYRLLYPVPAITSTVTGVINMPGNVRLDDSSMIGNWNDDEFKDCIVFIWAGPGRGQARKIVHNYRATGQMVLEDVPWAAADPPVGGQSRYGIERYAGEPTQHNPLKPVAAVPVYDDRSFSSTADILPAVIGAVAAAEPALNYSDVGKVGSVLYDSIRDYLTAAPARMPAGTASSGTVCINDWANDGYDNDSSGTVDDEANPTAQQLYDSLGLAAWAGADAAKINQAAQLVANIIDFRDADSIPTKLTGTEIGGLTSTVYGAEGLHLTEVMCAQQRRAVTGAVVDDGGIPFGGVGDDGIGAVAQPDGFGWDWISASGCWRQNSIGSATGVWTFTGLKNGFYAIRLQGDGGGTTFHVNFNADPDTTVYEAVVSTTAQSDGTYWGYVHPTGTSKLAAVEVASGSLTITIEAVKDCEFYGFQLLPQFIEFTNAAASDITIEAGASQLTLTTDAGSFTLPPGGTPVTVPGASADGKFPINYGTLVVALGEVPYEMQWGDDRNGFWGNTPNENYPVIFLETVGDAALDAMLMAEPFTYSVGMVSTDNTTNIITGSGGMVWTAAMEGMQIDIASTPSQSYIIPAGGVTAPDTLTMTGNCTVTTSTPVNYTIRKLTRPQVSLTQTLGGALIAGTPVADTINPGVDGQLIAPYPAWSSMEKIVLLQPTYDTTHSFWALHDDAAVALAASQNQHVTAPYDFYTNLNKQFTADIWSVYPGTLNTGLTSPTVLPIILNRPYPSPGWLGLVPTSNGDPITHTENLWRTVDANAAYDRTKPPSDPANSPGGPESMLGYLMDRACVGYDFAQVNLNTAPYAVLRSVLSRNLVSGVDNAAQLLAVREANPWVAWHCWDDVLNTALFRSGAGTNIGFSGNTIEDSGANSFGDDFVDDSDENEEWVRRYSNVFTLHSQTMTYVVAGLVYDQMTDPAAPRQPLAQVRLEVELEQTPAGVVVRGWRYLTD